MRKIIICVLFVVLMLSGCGGGKQRRISVAVIGKAENSYWNDVKLGAESAGRDLDVKVRFFAPPKEDPAWQIRKIEEIIAESVDGIAFAASDTKSIAPIISRAMQSEIPCIALDTDVAKSRHAYIGTRNYYAGQQAGEKMVELLDGKGEVAMVLDPSVPDFLQSAQGFRDILAEHKDVKIVATLEKKDDEIRALDIESLLGLNQGVGKPAYPYLNGIFCVSDLSGFAAAQYIGKANKVGQIKIICIGESSDIMKQVKDNVIQVAVSRRPHRLGYLSVLVLHNMAKAGIANSQMILPTSEIIDLGVVFVTPSNISQYSEELMKLGVKVKF